MHVPAAGINGKFRRVVCLGAGMIEAVGDGRLAVVVGTGLYRPNVGTNVNIFRDTDRDIGHRGLLFHVDHMDRHGTGVGQRWGAIVRHIDQQCIKRVGFVIQRLPQHHGAVAGHRKHRVTPAVH